jgi:hypothetical protein
VFHTLDQIRSANNYVLFSFLNPCLNQAKVSYPVRDRYRTEGG